MIKADLKLLADKLALLSDNEEVAEDMHQELAVERGDIVGDQLVDTDVSTANLGFS